MHPSFLLLTGFFWAASALSALAAPFDGKWVADIPAQNGCNYTSTMTLLVADGAITGQVRNPGNQRAVTGKVEADGTGSFEIGGQPATIKFTSDHFDASWQNSACIRHAEGDRDINPSQQAALVAERKQYQDRFADLVARAEAGDKKVDYTALRTAYAYSEHWDFYSPQVVSLLQQAAAAKKGGDCTTTMSATDDLLKLNFTVSEAHEFRHDCLEDTDRAKARIESDIADGLTDSILASGDGESEKTAYVVNTQEEENRVLVHKHYQLRGRQTEVRGADGHFYDTVTAIEIENTTFSSYVRARTIYFDVTSFSKARISKRAAVATAAASIH
jgi:hypothetical protein